MKKHLRNINDKSKEKNENKRLTSVNSRTEKYIFLFFCFI